MIQLNQKDIAPLRDKILKEQNGLCLLCNFKVNKPVLDHNHKQPYNIRGVLCASCNILLGKIENNYKRIGMNIDQLKSICPKIYEYMQIKTEFIHPNHKPKTKPFGKRNYNLIIKYWKILHPKKKPPIYPKNGKSNKILETYLDEVNTYLKGL